MAKIYGYIRDYYDIDIEKQRKALQSFKCDSIFEESSVLKKKERSVLLSLVNSLREGDCLVIYEIAIIFRSVSDFFNLLEMIYSKGAFLKVFHDAYSDVSIFDNSLLPEIVMSIDFYKKQLASRNTKNGLTSARSRGKKGGRKPKPNSEIDLALKMYDSKVFTIEQILTAAKISKATLYRYIRKRDSHK